MSFDKHFIFLSNLSMYLHKLTQYKCTIFSLIYSFSFICAKNKKTFDRKSIKFCLLDLEMSQQFFIGTNESKMYETIDLKLLLVYS